MMNWSLNIFDSAISLVPWFLRRVGSNLLWSTAQGLIWVTAQFQAWGTSGSGRHLDWVSTLVSPVQTLNNALVSFSTSIYYKLHITGQVIYLEHYLNDLYDADERRIFISDDNLNFPPYLYRTSDNIPVGEELLLYPDSNPIILYNQIDYFGQGQFIVNVPAALPVTLEFENRIRAAVNYYKQAGVTYKVQNF